MSTTRSTDQQSHPTAGLQDTVVWPIFHPPRIGQHLSLQHYFGRSERFPRETLQALQMRQARLLLGHAMRTVPYYREVLSGAGIEPDVPLSLETWLNIPLLKRDALQNRYPELQSTAIPTEHGKTFEISTSGSTGMPVRVTKTWLMQFLWNAVKLRDHLWHRGDVSDRKHAAIRFVEEQDAARPPDGLTSSAWDFPFNFLYDTGPACLLNIESYIDDQLKWLYRQNPHFLLTNPSNLFALAQGLQAQDRRLDNLEQITTISECLDPEVRQYCETVFEVPVKDIYSSQETGYIALQCPDNDHYHVQSETTLVEILDEEGRPCRPGEVGRVVVTSLHNFATPLIRYEIGDYAEPGEACSCGRTLPVLKRIYGRVRNMLVLPTGEKIWPRLRTQYYAETARADIRQAQLIQHSLEEIEVRLVVDKPLSEEQAADLTRMIRKALGHDFTIRYSFLDEIPRSKGGKFEEFISKIT